MPFGRLFGTLGGHIPSRSVALLGSHIAVIRYLVRNCFGGRICVHSESRLECFCSYICVHSESRLECFGSYIALVRYRSGSFDLSSLSGAFAGILDVRRMLGELIVLDRGLRSLALYRVCLLIHLYVCLPSLDSVHLSSSSESTSRFICRCACRC
jgi:hypothetical protein